ncbi:DUF1566 domain-containing protein [Photobacterium sp. 1_MG-2023]|uniref:Lcl C-terminal domain-containing protein n=1 Tax=Photobacterium sp. 1_MG-2023 TaxID=3062646 RepID=UPI0026E438CD|nr:DUF1566 domain-containing protein [Photobacterium sp. 1_MG-2023]MDO6708598.1 DUF1566 domain-containing protein [Photobacterium sp. 1_MG-2023]
MCAFNLWKTEVFRHGVFLPVLLSGCNADYQPVVPESTNTNTVVWQTTYAYPIVDTDQNRCYDSETGVEIRCTGAGYDADYQGNQPSYTTSSDGRTVLDNVTGLRWTQSTDVNRSGSVDEADLLSQSAAVHYCQTLRLGGYRWRLPNVKEAYSLMLFSGKDASTALGTEPTGLTPFLAPEFDRAFGVRAGERWMDVPYATGTLYVSTTMHGDATLFGVNYLTGRINGYPAERTKFYVRCVTGNTLYGQNSFFDNGNGTITDQATGLMWAQNDHSSRDWDHAIEICESATTAEHTDWRLPNVKELQSLVDYTRSPDTDGDAAIDVLFHSTGILNEAGLPDCRTGDITGLPPRMWISKIVARAEPISRLAEP